MSHNGDNTNKKSRRALTMLAWFGAAVLYYVLFSLLFDTPAEYELRHSTDRLKEEYNTLLAERDSLAVVVENVVERDKSIFAIMFESEPYNFDSEYNNERVDLQIALNTKSNSEMSNKLTASIATLEQKMTALEESYGKIDTMMTTLGSKRNKIPSIQPVTNHELTLLTAAYGTLMHPFYRTLQHHQGVDYAIPEGTRVFATADGLVKEIKGKNSTSGLTVIIDHGNGYTTSYSHLQSVKVKRGKRVQRGDIIALSGNSGLSLAPHLHYEVRYNGMRVDPIHHFFMELTPEEYQRIMRIAQSGMQSFD
ncbi:MAG: M23 family metallopeptidase [Alistipes sp.]|nr:M23 family metallopeptidase [Alistipes sp.]